MTVTKTFMGFFFATGLALACPAFAEEGPSSLSTASEAATGLAAGDDQVLDPSELESLAGGTGVDAAAITEQTLSAYNGGNTVSGYTVGSGEINIGSSAFSTFGGVGNFVLNTGHNNNLQSSLNVTIVLGQ